MAARISRFVRRGRLIGLFVLAALLHVGLTPYAAARVWYGDGVGVPLYAPPLYAVPPPYYYLPPIFVAPPVYQAPPFYLAPPGYIAPSVPLAPPGYVAPSAPPYPPPGFIAPPGFNSPGSPAGAQYCDAGPYRCPMERPSTPGAPCYCPGNSGQRVAGEVR